MLGRMKSLHSGPRRPRALPYGHLFPGRRCRKCRLEQLVLPMLRQQRRQCFANAMRRLSGGKQRRGLLVIQNWPTDTPGQPSAVAQMAVVQIRS